MLLGKRPRPPIKRTASMSGITVDPTVLEPQEPSDQYTTAAGPAEAPVAHNMNFVPNGGYDQRLSPMTSPRSIQRRNSGDHFIDTAHFLHTCGLCKRRLAPGRDIYMYRGDTAFCSLECREQQMKQDERKEKCTVASKKDGRHGSPSTASAKASSKSETVAAA
ncbi:FCS-Like Zinc finger 5-like [Corylus avellana]|uniref:FCS-Like Zinc finger 5-like n=1 Tax=Corylus avellana TaxID=13451 RepID=UPI001E214FCC|nr:FCS-Like Zinc finger 5-like [Corylus avellana]